MVHILTKIILVSYISTSLKEKVLRHQLDLENGDSFHLECYLLILKRQEEVLYAES